MSDHTDEVMDDQADEAVDEVMDEAGGRSGQVGSALRDAVRMESLRMFTVRSTYLILGGALSLGGVIAMVIALLAPENTPLSHGRSAAALTAGGDFLPLSVVGGLMALLGVCTVGPDYRFNLLKTVFVTQPRRGVMVTARLIVLGETAAGVALVVSLIGIAVCFMLGCGPAPDPGVLRVVGFAVLLAVLWAWVGAGLTWVLRSSAAAISLLLLGPLLLEPLIIVLGQGEVSTSSLTNMVRWLPFSAARQGLSWQLHATRSGIGALAGGAVFAGLSLSVVAVGCLLVHRRDA